jgi:hypothetical protein
VWSNVLCDLSQHAARKILDAHGNFFVLRKDFAQIKQGKRFSV